MVSLFMYISKLLWLTLKKGFNFLFFFLSPKEQPVVTRTSGEFPTNFKYHDKHVSKLYKYLDVYEILILSHFFLSHTWGQFNITLFFIQRVSLLSVLIFLKNFIAISFPNNVMIIISLLLWRLPWRGSIVLH